MSIPISKVGYLNKYLDGMSLDTVHLEESYDEVDLRHGSSNANYYFDPKT